MPKSFFDVRGRSFAAAQDDNIDVFQLSITTLARPYAPGSGQAVTEPERIALDAIRQEVDLTLRKAYAAILLNMKGRLQCWFKGLPVGPVKVMVRSRGCLLVSERS
jgi:hypothetical protein